MPEYDDARPRPVGQPPDRLHVVKLMLEIVAVILTIIGAVIALLWGTR